jgi:hypothetical protein
MYLLTQVVMILLLMLLVYIARETYRKMRDIGATLDAIKDRLDLMD